MTKLSSYTTLLLLLLLCSCSKGNGNADLIVSVEPQRALLQEIVGDKHHVRSLLEKNANPESFEPTMQTRMALEEAPIFFPIGLLPFEHNLTEAIPEGTKKVVNSHDGIDLIYGTHGHHHDDCDHHDGHGEHCDHDHDGLSADPHIWFSVRNARTIAAGMAEAMASLEPENADFYRANLRRLDARLDSLDQALSAAIDSLPVDKRAFAVWHPSLSYMARDYGLKQIAVGFENKEMSPAHLAEVAEQAAKDGVTILFFQQNLDPRQAETLNKAMGTRMVNINPLSADWEAQISSVIDALTSSR